MKHSIDIYKSKEISDKFGTDIKHAQCYLTNYTTSENSICGHYCIHMDECKKIHQEKE